MSDIKERPILFSASKVRAILEGRKTVRRNQQYIRNRIRKIVSPTK